MTGSLSTSSFSGQLRNLQSPLPASSSSLTFMQHLLCTSHSPRALQVLISSSQLSYLHYPDPTPGKWLSGFYPVTQPQDPCPLDHQAHRFPTDHSPGLRAHLFHSSVQRSPSSLPSSAAHFSTVTTPCSHLGCAVRSRGAGVGSVPPAPGTGVKAVSLEK